MTDIERYNSTLRYLLKEYGWFVIYLTGITIAIIIVFYPSTNAFAEPDLARDPDYDGCEIIQFRDQFYTPFRIEMIHEPATKQTVEDEHNDPASRLVFDKTEVIQDDAPTTVAFYSNSTDDWKIRVDLEYKTESPDPREILILIQTNNEPFLQKRIFHEGFDFCIVYDLWARPPTPILSTEQVLELADKISEENMKVLVDTVDEGNKAVTRGTDTNSVIAMVMILFIGGVLVSSYSIRRASRNLKKEMTVQKKNLFIERIKLDTAVSNLGSQKKKMDSFLDESEMRFNSMTMPDTKIRGETKGEIEDPYDVPEQIETPEPEPEPKEPEGITDKIMAGVSSLKEIIKPEKGEKEIEDIEHWKKIFKEQTNNDLEKINELYIKYQADYEKREKTGDFDRETKIKYKHKIDALYELIVRYKI